MMMDGGSGGESTPVSISAGNPALHVPQHIALTAAPQQLMFSSQSLTLLYVSPPVFHLYSKHEQNDKDQF